MQKRIQLIVAGVVLLLGVGIFALFALDESPATLDPVEEPPAPPIERELPAPNRPPSAVSTTLDGASARETAPATGFRLRRLDEVELAGRLVVLDELGSERTELDGTLALLVSDLEGARELEIAVTAGKFRARVPRGRALRCVSVRADGVAAVPESPLGWTPFPESGELDVRARFPRASSLRVIASDTGAELEHVEVALAPPVHPTSFAGIELHPGTQGVEMLRRDVSSPVLLPAASAISTLAPTQRLFVRAPGYAWCEVVVEPARPAEHLVVLEPGGELEVHLVGHAAGEVMTLLRASVPGGPTISIAMDLGAADVALVESLPFGVYQVQVFTHRKDHHGSLAIGAAEVRAGERARLDLEVAKAPPHEPAIPFLLEGVVVVPREWELASFALVLRAATSDFELRLGAEDVAPVEGEDDAWSFRVEDLPFDTYDLAVEPCGHAVEIEPLRSTVRVEVPRPAAVSLALTARESGETSGVELVGWRTGALRRGPRREVPRDPRSGRFEFRVPAGEVEISPMPSGRPQLPTLFPVSAGENELELEVVPAHAVHVELVCEGQRIAPPSLFAPSTVPVQAGQRRTGYPWIPVQGPGRYALELPSLPGFEPIAPREIDVPYDGSGIAHVAVELVRAR